MKNKNINQLCIDNLRMLAVDSVQKANSGHPGLPLGLGAILFHLYKNHLKVNPKAPHWINRDRFILSPGHGSALLYALNYFAGYDLSLDEIINFRQLHYHTAGHPEYNLEKGIEVTTGPLGQGIGMAVGLAIAERYLNQLFYDQNLNQSLIDHHVYCVVGDGDLQEGISYEAMSLAGRLKLNKLIFLFDANHVQLDTMTKVATNENFQKRFESQNWHYLYVDNPYSEHDLNLAINEAKKSDQPTIIQLNTIIGKDSPLEHSPKVHGAPFSKDDYQKLQNKLGFEKPFTINPEVKKFFNHILKHKVAEYEKATKPLSKAVHQKLNQFLDQKLSLEEFVKNYSKKDQALATRSVMNDIFAHIKDNQFYLAGSADLSGSTKVNAHNGVFDAPNYNLQEIKYGVREFTMGAIANGISLHSNLRTFTGTFLIFADYMKPAIRLGCLMETNPVYCFSHDSVFLGEDGPTHQPIEQLALLRSIPNINVYRPSDYKELASCFELAYNTQGHPSAIVLSRQNIDHVPSTNYFATKKGGYIIGGSIGFTNFTIIATGSELPFAYKVYQKLTKTYPKLSFKIVSMPSYELFKKQDAEYQDKIIHPNSELIQIEASASFGRKSYFGNANQHLIGINRFGASGSYSDLLKYFGFDEASLYDKIKLIIEKHKEKK